jgi:hypothetical protein
VRKEWYKGSYRDKGGNGAGKKVGGENGREIKEE